MLKIIVLLDGHILKEETVLTCVVSNRQFDGGFVLFDVTKSQKCTCACEEQYTVGITSIKARRTLSNVQRYFLSRLASQCISKVNRVLS